ncbi:MAG: cell division protein FtsZ [Alphaproteobacteria bacterium]|nr:cell division protein FtsZ [Alphaproteobacteria bacterium]
MTLNISVPTSTQELRPKITVIGVGGAGGNAVNNMIAADLEGVDFLVANTDGQALAGSLATRKIQLGRAQTQGLGAGSQPEIGRIAAEESLDDIMAELADCHMVFITAGMGGGTGTGAAPVIAKAARERGILTVGVVTKPFDFEGQKRMGQATTGIEELQAYVDTLIIIPNQNLFRLANERTTFADAFAMADEVLHKGVCGVTDLMIKPGNINLDFADIRTVMSEMGKAMMGTGEASGENRATNAAEAAINNPLLDETTMSGAQAVLINITGGKDMTLFEVDEAANHIRREVDSDATIIFGSALDDKMEGIMRVSVVATGMEAQAMANRPAHSAPLATPRPQPSFMTAATPAPEMAPEMTQEMAPEMEPAMDDASADSIITDHDDIPFELTSPVEGPVETDMVETGPVETDMTEAQAPSAVMTDATEAETPAPEQHDIEDMMAEMEIAKAEMEAELAAQDADADTSVREEPEATTADAPFIMRPTVDIPEEEPKAEQQDGPKSLIGHLSRMMFSSKSSATPAATSGATPAEEPVLETRDEDRVSAKDSLAMDTVTIMTADASMDAPADASMDAPAAPAAPAADGDNASGDDIASEQPQQPATGIASLKPTSQPQLEINRAGVDEDLDIPAFLRRQAN